MHPPRKEVLCLRNISPNTHFAPKPLVQWHGELFLLQCRVSAFNSLILYFLQKIRMATMKLKLRLCENSIPSTSVTFDLTGKSSSSVEWGIQLGLSALWGLLWGASRSAKCINCSVLYPWNITEGLGTVWDFDQWYLGTSSLLSSTPGLERLTVFPEHVGVQGRMTFLRLFRVQDAPLNGPEQEIKETAHIVWF